MTRKSVSILVSLMILCMVAVKIVFNPDPVYAAGDFTEINNYIGGAMRRYKIPGAAVAITQGNQVTFSQGYGTDGNGQAVTADTPFYIGSQSKSFTALAVMQLVEQGKLELDAPVQTYLPWFRVADEQASQQITVRNLLQHTSGLSEAGYVATFSQDTPLETQVRDLARARITAPVGTKMQYFNPGYDTLGLIIETVSGQSYGSFINEHIFVPLKMMHSFTDPAAAQAAGLAQGYSQIFMLAFPLNQPFYQSDLPAGYIISSASDMARYQMALLNGGELEGVRVLKPENVKLLFTPNSGIGSTYGFGWFISTYYGETQITHGGDTERFHTAVLLLPEKNMSVVMLFNVNHLLKDFNDFNTLFWSVAGLLTGNPLPKEGISSIIYGWGLLALWVVILTMLERKIKKLPQWRIQMMTWDAKRRWKDILPHLFWIVFTIVAVVVIGPALLQRGFSMRWFVSFLPDVAIITATLVLDDLIQVIFKTRAILTIKSPDPK